MLISTTAKTRAVAARARIAPVGNGKSVIGRSNPTLMPRRRAVSATARSTRPTMPYPTKTMSASSTLHASHRGSDRSASRYLASRARMCPSSTSGSRWMELTRFCRVAAVPVTAHAGAAGTGRGSGKETGSIICPTLPSASTTTGLQ